MFYRVSLIIVKSRDFALEVYGANINWRALYACTLSRICLFENLFSVLILYEPLKSYINTMLTLKLLALLALLPGLELTPCLHTTLLHASWMFHWLSYRLAVKTRYGFSWADGSCPSSNSCRSGRGASHATITGDGIMMAGVKRLKNWAKSMQWWVLEELVCMFVMRRRLRISFIGGMISRDRWNS